MPTPALNSCKTMNFLRGSLMVAALLLGACGSDAQSTASAGTVLGACASQDDCSESGGYCNVSSKQCVEQCNDAKGISCGSGKVCSNKQCVAAFGGDAGTTDVNGGSDAGPTDTSTTDTSTNDTLTDSTVGKDTAVADTSVQPSSDNSCHVCKTAGDCGDGFDCVPLLSGSFCSKKCAAVQDCAAGYSCEKATSATQKYCVLPTYDCKGCAVDGCPSTQQCNYKVNPPACQDAKGQCSTCVQDKECGNGLRCVKFGASKICAPDCSSGQTCPGNSTCVPFVTAGTKACAFNATTCCYGSSCTSACANCPDKCIAGQCVACTKDADCAGGTCNVTTYTCVTNAACPPPGAPTKKIKKTATGECVECLNDTHCVGNPTGSKCNLQSNLCEAGSSTNECSVCGGDYPGCVQLNGTWTCVECSTDADCAAKSKGTCSSATYSCSGTTGGGVGPKSGTCKTDADCPADPNGTFDMACDAGSGLCYDKAGKCDGVTAFCNAAAGSDCDMTGGLGGLGGLPTPGGGGTPAPTVGSCTCGTGGSTGGTPTQKIVNSTCQQVLASPLGALTKLGNCDCTQNATNPDCSITDIMTQQPIDCCSSGSSGGGPMDCLGGLMGGGGGTPSPSCFGGLACGVNPMDCFAGKTTGSCGGGGLGF